MFGLAKQLFGGQTRAYRQEIGGGWGSSETVMMKGLASGLTFGTRVATATGWRPAESVAVGDLVLTFDRGMQSVRQITRSIAWAGEDMPARALWPISVPAGALGNAEPLMLMPDQLVMLESDTAEILYGDPFTLVNAADLDGLRGIARVPPQGATETVMLHFDQGEVVFVGDGALVFCGQGGVIALNDLLSGRARMQGTEYRSLDADAAMFLVESLELEDAVLDGADPAQQESRLYAAWA